VDVNNSQRDGAMQMGKYSGPVNYEPASIDEGAPMESPVGTQSTFQVGGDAIRKKISKTNDFQQAEAKYLSLSKTDQEHLINNLIADLTPIQKKIQERAIANLTKANSELGKSVAKGLKI
jgi:catalase